MLFAGFSRVAKNYKGNFKHEKFISGKRFSCSLGQEHSKNGRIFKIEQHLGHRGANMANIGKNGHISPPISLLFFQNRSEPDLKVVQF